MAWCSVPEGASQDSFSPLRLHGVPQLALVLGAYGKPFPDESPGNWGLIQVPHTPLLGLVVSPRTLQHLPEQEVSEGNCRG